MISNSGRNFLAMAVVAAKQSGYRHRLGCVIVSGGRVRGVGWSKRRNKPANVSDDHVQHCSVHAEMDALRGLGYLGRATAYVARLGAAGTPVLAKPCSACQGHLAASGVTRVYWTTEDGYESSRLDEMGENMPAIREFVS